MALNVLILKVNGLNTHKRSNGVIKKQIVRLDKKNDINLLF